MGRMTRDVAIFLLSLVTAACGNHHRETYCPGEAPSVEECEEGTFFVDCGGTGPPILACGNGDDPRCAWFPGGCVPQGMRPSTCDAEDICCHDGFPADGTELEGFPFSEGELDQRANDWLLRNLWHYGIEPWNRTRDMVLSVAVASELPPEPTALTCTGFDYPEFVPCIAGTLYVSRLGKLLTVEFSDGGWGPVAEIHVDISELHARAYLFPVRDAFSEKECPPPSYETVATRGEIVLNRLPTATEGPYNLTDIWGQVSIDFAEGMRIEGVLMSP